MLSLKNLKKNYLYLVVFLTGACVLVIEVVAVRILSPFFGNTIYSFSSILSVILGALSLGYYFGGRMADKNANYRHFYYTIIISGVTTLMIQILRVVFLESNFHNFSTKSGPLVFSIIMFFLPGFFLGILSPYAITLIKQSTKKGIGKVSGNVFFYSTIGSITGSLLTGFYLIPNFGIDLIINSVGLFLILLGIFSYILVNKFDKSILTISLFTIIITLLTLQIKTVITPNTVFYKEGVYDRIHIVDLTYNQRPTRVLLQDTNTSSGQLINSDELVFTYTKFLYLYQIVNPEISSALFLGGGAFIMPDELLSTNKSLKVDVLEIEPELFEISQRFFRLNNHSLINEINDDARYYLNSSDKYDLIFIDVYSSGFSIPAHITTLEFFQLVKSKVNDKGLVIMNVIGELDSSDKSLGLSIYKTFDQVFANNYVFAMNKKDLNSIQNIIVLGVISNEKLEFIDQEIRNGSEVLNLNDYFIDTSNIDLSNQLILTDNYAPVESLSKELYNQI